MHIFFIFSSKNLHMSEKSSTFASAFEKAMFLVTCVDKMR